VLESTDIYMNVARCICGISYCPCLPGIPILDTCATRLDVAAGEARAGAHNQEARPVHRPLPRLLNEHSDQLDSDIPMNVPFTNVT
jgi:hypothetical protein